MLRTELKPPSIRNVVIELNRMNGIKIDNFLAIFFFVCNPHKYAVILAKNDTLNAACMQNIIFEIVFV